MVSPRPWPRPRSDAPVRNRWGPSASSSGGKPSPWSRTVTVVPATCTSTGGRPCRWALTTRLTTIRSSRRGSVRAGSTSVLVRCTLSPARANDSSTTSAGGTVMRSARSLPASSREISSRSSTRVRSTPTRSRTRSVASDSGSSPAAVTSPIKGVRSSWATSAVKRCSVSRRPCRLSAIESTAAEIAVISSPPRRASILAVRSPDAIRPAVRATRRSRRLGSSATSADTGTTTASAISEAFHMCRSRARRVSRSDVMSTCTATGRPRYVCAAHIDGWSPRSGASYQVTAPPAVPCRSRSRCSSSPGMASGDVSSPSGGTPFRS